MAAPTVQSSTGSASASGTTGGNWPTTSTDDIIINTLSLTGSASPAATIPSGYTLLSDDQVGTTSGDTIRLITCWKRCVGAETNPAWSAITGYRFWQYALIRGCPTSGDPYNLLSSGTKTPASTSWPAIALGSSDMTDNLLLYFGATDVSTATQMSAQANSALTSITEQYDTGVAGSSGAGRNLTSGILAGGGDTGTFTATITSSLNVWFALCMTSTTSTPIAGTNSNFLAFM